MKVYKVYTSSVVHTSSEDFKDKTPYIISILQDEKGDKITAVIEGYKEGLVVNIGQEVFEKTDENGVKTYHL